MTDREEQEVWRRFREGNEQAFTTIYTTYFQVLYRYGYHIARDEETVKDCIQSLFVELWRSRQNLSDTTSIRFYLLKAMRRKLYRSLRKEEMYIDFSPELDDAGMEFSPELALITQQTNQHQQEALRQAIDQLTRRQKEAITLLYIDGLSYMEVSGVMALQVRSVYNLIHTALESLRKHLNQPGVWIVLAVLSACV